MKEQTTRLSDVTFALEFRCGGSKTTQRALFRFYDLQEEVNYYKENNVHDPYVIILDEANRLVGPDLTKRLLDPVTNNKDVSKVGSRTCMH